MDTILVIDLGTTLIKGSLYDEVGNILSHESIHYPLIKPGGNRIEQDPGFLWEIVKKIIERFASYSDVKKYRIRTITLSSQGISIIPVNREGMHLYNMISWLDGRADQEVRDIKKRFSERDLFLITGKRLNAFYSLPKILWLKNHKSAVFNNLYKILLPLDFIFFKLTGMPITDHTMAAGTMLYNIKKRDWSDEILAAFGLDKKMFPGINNSGYFSMPMLSNLSEELGIKEDVKVFLGAQDQKCAAIGAGIESGTAVISMGTCTAVLVECERAIFDSQMRIPIFSFVRNNYYVLEAVINTTGAILNWLKDNFFKNKNFDQITIIAKDSKTGSNGIFFFPHFEGAGTPYLIDSKRGFLYGLSLSTRKEDIIRAFLEGVAFQIRHNLEIIEEISDKKIKKLKIIGGGAKSDVWCSIIADITGKSVFRYKSSEVASLGAAIMAGVGSRIFKDFRDGYEKMKNEEEIFKPNKRNMNLYDKLYKEYLDIEKKLIYN